MRIAVVGKCQFSMFSGSQANATVAVAETLKLQGHDVNIVSVGTDAVWWDDVNLLKAAWEGKVVRLADVKEPFDLAIEVGHHLESVAERATLAKKSVVLFRKHTALDEIEHSLFPTSGTKRCWEGVSEVWAFDAFSNADDVQILETISRLPVYRVPYVWTPSVNEKHREETQSPLWIQMTNSYLHEKGVSTLPWSFHVAETNTTSASSCTLPVLIMREAMLKKKVEASKFRIHNADHVYKSKFFQDNVWRHARVEDLSGDFVGRQRVVDWVFEPMSCVITHQRFTPFRPMLLDLAWVGIPFVHNSQLIRDIGGGLNRFYYPDNRISEAVDALGRITEDFTGRTGYFSIDGLNTVRRGIMERLTPYSGEANALWRTAVDRVLGTITVVPVPVPVPAPAPAPSPMMFGQAATSLPVAAVPSPVPVAAPKQTLTVGFSDMWDSFNPSYNFFTLLLEEAASHLTPPLKIVGKQITESSVAPDILIFGPFGDTWTKFPTVPKAHFTGENSAPISGPNVELNMCFPHVDMVKDDYLRLPLWILEIDWFGADPEKIVNPKPIPIDSCTKSPVSNRNKFCAFIVSNPNNPLRNAAFQWLSSYKHVDSAGALFNNVGNKLAAGPGGGGGELKKLEFLKDYKFCITYENSSGQGYVTEKLLHAKAAGCVPIYWGDPKVNRDFNTKGFICAQDFKTPGELIEAVRRVDENDALYREMVAVPALDDYKLDWTRRTLSFCAGRLLAIGLRKEVELPRFLGARSSAEAAQRLALRGPVKEPVKEPVDKKGIELPFLVTFVTRRFLPSLQLWLTAADAQYKTMKGLRARVYYGADVPQDTLQKLTDTFKFVETCPIPSEAPADFPDLWEPQHFAWKIWIYKTLVAEAALADRMVLYMDAGCFMCRWPSAWLQKAQESDICFLEDPRQTNGQWCHAEFCRQLAVTDSEKGAKQIVAGILAFRAGTPAASTLFAAAWSLAQKRSVIVGEKWSSASTGHRHDQSILSILSQRQGTSRFPLDDVYADKSLRNTYQMGRSIYCHRGAFRLNAPFSEGIDDCYIINLDRREDRMDRLYQTTPDLKERATRFSAIEGKKLELTPSLARLFRPHDFMWKKAIMGCALSHLSLWWKLVNEHQDIETFLILEDDVKLKPEWEMRWKVAQPHLPEDWDIIYLGGILPPNRAAFEHTKERVNDHFSRVAENRIFGQNPPNRYFHWCAYAYVLSRRGAQKVLEVMAGHDGYWTSADHMLCNPINHIRMYFLDPLVAGCYQDEDPKYANSAFNDFNRVDSFDSDLWNNDERFSKELVDQRLAEVKDKEVDIATALKEARDMMVVGPELPAESPAKAPAESPAAKAPAESPAKAPTISQPPTNFKHRLLCLEGMNLDISKLHEKEWLYELLGKPSSLPIESVSMNAQPVSCETPIFIVMRPWPHKYNIFLNRWSSLGAKFYILHLSDEHGTDDLSFYDFPGCLKVVRMYDRPDLTAEQRAKCVIVPLGYHWTLRGGGCPMPLERTPRLPFRNTRWSFFGTNWKNRDQKLAPIMGFGPNRCKLLEDWNATNMVGYDEYIGTLLDTIFVPCPGGQNAETFRYYEALECGCIPIVVREPGDELFVKYITSNMPILPVNSWTEAAGLMNQLYADKNLLENYRTNLLIGWRVWKEKLVAEVRAAFQL